MWLYHRHIQPAITRLTAETAAAKAALEREGQASAHLAVEKERVAAEAQALRKLEADLSERAQAVANLTEEEARELMLSRLGPQLRAHALVRCREMERVASEEVEVRARAVLLGAMERDLPAAVSEATLSVVSLPSEDLKGRIIGREGRNKRAFEQVTGVDLLVDETPESVALSCFDPLRREAARLTLLDIMSDGKIHPARIEEAYLKATQHLETTMAEAGTEAASRAQVADLPSAVRAALGHLKYRTSLAQNVLDHSIEVAHLAAQIAAEVGGDARVARRAGLLHDIGKALDVSWEGPHALAGMRFLAERGESEPVCHAVGAHHRQIEPATAEAVAVILADGLSAARPGARREALDKHVLRLRELEELVDGHPGVAKSYAVQGGREVRVIVRPEEVDDLGAALLATEVAQKIETSLEYPGQIIVTVIREVRTQQVAR